MECPFKIYCYVNPCPPLILYLSLGRGSLGRGVTAACRGRSVHCCRWWGASAGGRGGRAAPRELCWTVGEGKTREEETQIINKQEVNNATSVHQSRCTRSCDKHVTIPHTVYIHMISVGHCSKQMHSKQARHVRLPSTVNITACACDRPCDAIWTGTKEHLKRLADTCQNHYGHLAEERTVCPVQQEKQRCHRVQKSHQQATNKHNRAKVNWVPINMWRHHLPLRLSTHPGVDYSAALHFTWSWCWKNTLNSVQLEISGDQQKAQRWNCLYSKKKKKKYTCWQTADPHRDRHDACDKHGEDNNNNQRLYFH